MAKITRGPLVAGAIASLSVAGLWLANHGTAPPGRVWVYRPYSFPDLSAKVMSSCLKGREGFASLMAWIASEESSRRPYLSFSFEGAFDYGPVASDPAITYPRSDRSFAEGLGAFLGARDFSSAKIIFDSALKGRFAFYDSTDVIFYSPVITNCIPLTYTSSSFVYSDKMAKTGIIK